MTITSYVPHYDFRKEYPNYKKIGSIEGGVIYSATTENKFIVTADETMMSEFIPLEQEHIITIIISDSEEELNNYLGNHYGGTFSFRSTGKEG